MKIILTGSTGFIGRNLLQLLIKDKKILKILLILRDKSKLDSRFLLHPKIEILKIDLTKTDIPRLTRYDTLVHLADNIPIRGDILNFSDNLKITENIVKNLILNKLIRNIIYTSTLDVYGRPNRLPIDESHPTVPLTFYGISKLSSELFIKKAAEIYNTNYLILRLSHVYGQGEVPIKVIPLFINKIKKNRTIILNNNGHTIRDWVYIKDVTEAIRRSIYLDKSGMMNIATGEGHSLRELVYLLGKILGKKPKVIIQEESSDLRPEIILKTKVAQHILDFQPIFNLERGLRDYLK